MKEIKLIIFDLDGTLIDAYPAIYSSFNYVMSKFGLASQKPLVIRRAVGWGDDNLLRPFVPGKELNKALKMYRRHHRLALVKKSHVFKGVRQLLNGLKDEGYKLAVASNRPTEFSLILLRHLKLKKYFDYVLCADKLKKGKPDPDMLNRIMRKLKMFPDQTIYAGDMIIDAQAGRRAKVKTIVVTTGSSTKSELAREKPFRIIKDIRRLKTIL